MPRNSDFQTVHTEGGLLPADQLSRIATGQADGLAPTDYGLPPGERVNETISQCWVRLRKHWADFAQSRASVPEDQPGTDVTNQKWLRPLFESLGYGRLTTSKAPEIDGKTYPITRYHGRLPIHFVGCNISLDTRSPGVKGAATGTPHGLVQEFLNRTDDHLWAFVSNGRQLRILRDNVALSRQAYIEFDLEAMFDGEVYSDFALLWMVCHVTRTEGERPELCWLEKWSAAAREHGTRVLENLRNGVERAIEALGRGFVSHPANDVLRQKLRNGELDKQNLYRQVLRTVYRLLFLFVAEDRNLLHPSGTTDEARQLYDQHYSTRRLRDLAGQIKGSRHGDLWHVLSMTFAAVSGEESAAAIRTHLGLPALGSRLWRVDEAPDIVGPSPACPEAIVPAQLSNDDLLDAVRHLAYVQQEHTLQSVNYRDLGSEELGSVYESLLELQPDIHPEARKFELRTVTGSERKTTGSYYTPDSLVQCLLDSALEPVIKDRLDAAKTPEDKQQVLLDLTVCDPACGSGHFLIAAAQRIARHLARLRSIAAGEAEPTPDVYQHALRDVIAHCIYGVDINPMAVELCKVSLWLEALDPGRPLAFLDHHIQCGNSLLGTTPALLKSGIPDDAFKPIEGDDKEVCKELKKENREDRKKGRRLWGALPWLKLGNMAQTFANIDAEDDSTPEALAAKEKRYREAVSSSAYENARFLADAWCAAFVWPKADARDQAVTTDTIRRIEDNPHEYPPGLPIREGVRKLADQYQFFHWHLVFPDIFRVPAEGEQPENEQAGWSGGFDCVLGNPPWDMQEVKDNEFFASSYPDVLAVKSAKDKASVLLTIQSEVPQLWQTYMHYVRTVHGQKHFMLNTGRYPLAAVGRLNLYRIFLETSHTIVSTAGRVGMVVPSGFASDAFSQEHFTSLHREGLIPSLLDFENREGLFPGVHRSQKFCLLTLAGSEASTVKTDFVFFAHAIEELSDPDRHIPMSAADLSVLNPLTGTAPLFRSNRDRVLTLTLQKGRPIVASEKPGGWGLTVVLMFMVNASMTHHRTREELEEDGFNLDGNRFTRNDDTWYPLYEGKMVGAFDHRAASIRFDSTNRVRRNQPAPIGLGEHCDAKHFAMPMFWVSESQIQDRCGLVPEYCLAVKDVTSSTNVRTAIASILPKAGLTDSVPWLKNKLNAHENAVLLAALNSFAFDFVARQKVAGLHLRGHYLAQLPLPTRDSVGTGITWEESTAAIQWLASRSTELTYSAWDLEAFAARFGYDGPPFVWDEERRFVIRCELDAAFFHLYLGSESEWRESGSQELLEYFPTPRHAVEYIMETFPIVRRKDEAAHGSYRTKDTILEIYDEMAEIIAANEAARAAGQPATAQYQTRLDPPPGPPTDEAGNFIPYADWTPEIHARYKNVIHPPREHVEVPDLDIAAMADAVYPMGQDEVICAVAAEIAKAAGTLPSMDHLDAVLLATHPEWCRVFLADADASRLDAAVASAPNGLVVAADASVRWSDCRDYLEQRGAIAVAHSDLPTQAISAGTNNSTTALGLPAGTEGVAALAVKALEKVRTLRAQADAATEKQREILAVFQQQHTAYALTGTDG